MNRFIFALSLCGAIALSAFAEKESVAIREFDYASSAGSNQAAAVRSKVIEGITNTNRVNVVDYDNDAALAADYVLDGHLISATPTSSYTNGKTTYNAKVNYSLKVTDKNGNVICSQTFESSSPSILVTYSSSTDAINAAVNHISSQMKDFVDGTFKIRGPILEISEAKKNEAKKLYIGLGSADGVTKGLKFDVKKEKSVAGRTITNVIGELKVESVDAPDMSLCKVTKGGTEVFQAVNNGDAIIVESKVNGNIFGL